MSFNYPIQFLFLSVLILLIYHPKIGMAFDKPLIKDD